MLSLAPGLGWRAVPQVLLEMRKEQNDVLASSCWLDYDATGKTELNEFLTGDKEKHFRFCRDIGTWNAQLRLAPDTPHWLTQKWGNRPTDVACAIRAGPRFLTPVFSRPQSRPGREDPGVAPSGEVEDSRLQASRGYHELWYIQYQLPG